MRVLFVLNQKSRRGSHDGPLVWHSLKELGIDCETDPRASGIDAVVAAGGDGTVISALPAAIARGVPLGIIPLGTFNDLARTLGIPLGIPQACEVLLEGTSRPIDLGHVNGTYFVNEASIGLSTRIARRQTSELKQRFGVLAVLSTTLQSLRAIRRFFVELEYEDGVETFATIQLTVANSARFGGIIERPNASIDDGWLDLYSFEPRSWMQAIRVAGRLIARSPRSEPGLRIRRAKRFAVRTHRAHHVGADGEPAGMTPAVFHILPKAVRILVPKAAACSTELSGIQDSNSQPSDLARG